MAIKDYITVKNVIFLIVAVLFVKFISKISGIAMMFFASYVLACSFSPLVEILSKKIKGGYFTKTALDKILKEIK